MLIDGVPMGAAQYGCARPDVCKASPTSLGCPSVGWYYLLDTRALADGVHTLEAIEVTASGNAAASRTFNVSNAGVQSPLKVVIDSLVTNATLTGTWLISGWAINGSDSIATVAISVDDLPRGFAAYGGARAHVCGI